MKKCMALQVLQPYLIGVWMFSACTGEGDIQLSLMLLIIVNVFFLLLALCEAKKHARKKLFQHN